VRLAVVLRVAVHAFFLPVNAYAVWRVGQHQIDARQQRQHFAAVAVN
jgi:hypothetical protein